MDNGVVDQATYLDNTRDFALQSEGRVMRRFSPSPSLIHFVCELEKEEI